MEGNNQARFHMFCSICRLIASRSTGSRCGGSLVGEGVSLGRVAGRDVAVADRFGSWW